ncbi:MAG TPA: hypothetical protein VGD78_16540 [Chthoniobacterales bacterium]
MSLELNLLFGSLASLGTLYSIATALRLSRAFGMPEFADDLFHLFLSALWAATFGLIYLLPRFQGRVAAPQNGADLPCKAPLLARTARLVLVTKFLRRVR